MNDPKVDYRPGDPPLNEGDLVVYHGELWQIIERHKAPESIPFDVPDPEANCPDGHLYDLWRVAAIRKLGNTAGNFRRYVRRISFRTATREDFTHIESITNSWGERIDVTGWSTHMPADPAHRGDRT